MNRTILTICVAAAAFSGCQKHKPAETPLTAVRTVAAELTTVSNDVRYSGTVAPDTQVDLAFRVAGYVARIGGVHDAAGGYREFQEGDFVDAGTVLAQLRPTEYQARASYSQAVAADATASLTALEAQLAESEASLLQAERDYERAGALFAERAMTKADFDGMEARHNTARARRDAVKAQIASQQARIEGAAAQHRDAALNLSDTTLTAPFPGVVVAKKIARGSLVAAGTPAFTIADTRVVKISFGVPDLALRNFNSGKVLTVKAEALREREFRGHVTSIAAAADPASRVFPVEVTIPNASQVLKVGMVATVVVAGAHDAVAKPAIPLSAVVKSDAGGYGVYAVESDRVRLQAVTLGPVRGNDVVVTAGLNPGQRIVATAGLQLADGERVKQIP